jgi:hypothetical protein
MSEEDDHGGNRDLSLTYGYYLYLTGYQPPGMISLPISSNEEDKYWRHVPGFTTEPGSSIHLQSLKNDRHIRVVEATEQGP